MNLRNLHPNQLLKWIILIKLCVLVGFWIASDDRFYFGDKPLQAQQDTTEETTPDETNETHSEEIAASGDESPQRQSFLDELLKLPTIDPNEVKKDELGKFLQLAERKQQQINQRLELLGQREEQLINLENSVNEKLTKLEEERTFFTQTLQREKEIKGKRLDRLIATYEKMEPRAAAPIFEKLDKDLAVALLKNLKQKQMMKIIEAMDADVAVQTTEYFGRVRSTREYDLLKEMNASLKKEFEDCRGMPKDK